MGVATTGIIKLTHFGGNQTMETYGNFEGFPLYQAKFHDILSKADPGKKKKSSEASQSPRLKPTTIGLFQVYGMAWSQPEWSVEPGFPPFLRRRRWTRPFH